MTSENETPEDTGGTGKVDLASLLYLLGIPAMVAFFVVLFTLTHTCGIAA